MLNLRAAIVEPDGSRCSAGDTRGAKLFGIRFVPVTAEELGGSLGSGNAYDDGDEADGECGVGRELDGGAGVSEDGQLDSVVHLAQDGGV